MVDRTRRGKPDGPDVDDLDQWARSGPPSLTTSSPLFLARMLAGLGAFCAVVVAISLVADMTTPQTRGRVMILPTLGV